MKTKVNKDSRNLMIAILLGDGSINNANTFKMCHCQEQKDYIEWKINLLNEHGLRNNGLKSYTQMGGYKPGGTVYYSQLYMNDFIKTLRRVMYKPKKIIGNRKILNRINALGVAIWYMDDGHINIRKTGDKVHGFYIKIATCEPIEQVQVIVDYFKEVWDVAFYPFKEGKNTYSLCCGTKEGLKFIDIVKPYVMQVPSMIHKITFDLSQRTKSLYDKESLCSAVARNGKHSEMNEDIV